PRQHTITVRDRFAVAQSRAQAAVFLRGRNLMSAAFDRLGAAHDEIERKAMTRIAQQRERLPPGVSRTGLVVAHVSWRGCQRNSQRPAGAFGPRKLRVRSLDSDLLIGLNASHAQRKYVGRFARRQRSLPAFTYGLVVIGLRLLAFLQFGADLNIAEGDTHAGHGGVAGQREAIDRFEGPAALLFCITINLRQP